jgi:hypothetical protein
MVPRAKTFWKYWLVTSLSSTYEAHFELFNDSISAEQLMHITVYLSSFVYRMYGVLLLDQRANKITKFFGVS